MIFSTPIFLFAFLPLFLVTYYATPDRHKTLTLLVASCLFYGWWKLSYLMLVLGIAALSFVAGNFASQGSSARIRTWAVKIGIAGNLAVLGWFKYAYFIAGSFDDALAKFGAMPGNGIQLPEIILPIGLSFLVFQSISYILDVARQDAPPAQRLIDFLAFSSLFPQLIAGPILRYKDLAHQFQHRTHDLETFAAGVVRFTTGLAMKILIADSIAPLADRMFELTNPTMAEAWLGALAYALQLFFDFAGYSAMAIGLGLMLGFRFPENFDAPYISQSITEFWRRWHISLSTWLRDYLYVPLGGNRGGEWLTYRNLMLTMVLGGLWHGANWTFLVWGLWHGGLMAIERALGSKQTITVWPRTMAWPLTMVFVLIGWVVFRADNLGDAGQMYAGMIGLNGLPLSPEMAMLIRPSELLFVAIGALLSVYPVWFKIAGLDRVQNALRQVWQTTVQTSSLALFCVCTIVIQARGDAPFLYFQF